jgi:UDP-glucose:(heptosyl)LPS alpha-1,3-glucosyltransferase
MREQYPDLADRVVVIHNGVDADRFAPDLYRDAARALRSRLQIPEGRLVAAFVGGEWERKGLEQLIQALALAPAWQLLVAGNGDRKRYQRLAESLGIARAVHWLDVTPEVQLVYELADAFVLPSSYETFSLVTFEAAASALPILTTPVSGVSELIADGRSGFLITREPGDIAERLMQLAADPALRSRLGGAARLSALKFTWNEMVAKHHELYLGLADSCGCD